MSTEVQKLREHLQDLKSVDYSSADATHKTNCKAYKALNSIFQIGCKKVKLTQDEKNTIGALLAEVLKPIQISISCTSCQYRKRLETAVLWKRSAVQFLIDDFGDLTVGNARVSSLLQESKEILDRIISNFAEEVDSDEGDSREEVEAGARVVPSSHTWWSQ